MNGLITRMTNNKAPIIVSVFILLFALAYVGYTYYSQGSDNTPPEPPIDTAEPNTEPPDETEVTVKSYTNTQFAFSFSYPATWQLTEEEASPFTKENTKLLFEVTVQQSDNQRVTSVSVFSNKDGLALGAWIDKYNPNPYAYTNTKVDSELARKYEKTSMGTPTINLYVTLNGYVYSISSTFDNSDFAKILESFEFIRS